MSWNDHEEVKWPSPKMREASNELRALADRLPSIPIETLTRGA